jgi:outer membrane protein assembly factor BamB
LDGDILWERTLQDSYPNYAFDIVVYGGKVYVTGYSTEKSPVPLMLAAYDFDGNLLWRKSWTGVWGHLDGVEIESGGIGFGLALYKRHLYLAGEFSQPGDVLLQKYDLDGNVVLTSTWDCCDHVIVPGLHNRTGFDAANDIVMDNGVAWVAGESINLGLDSSSLLLKYDLHT